MRRPAPDAGTRAIRRPGPWGPDGPCDSQPPAVGRCRILLHPGGPGIGEEQALGAALVVAAAVDAGPVDPGLQRRQVERLEHVLPAADAGVLGPDGGADGLALGLGQPLPGGAEPLLAGLVAPRLLEGPGLVVLRLGLGRRPGLARRLGAVGPGLEVDGRLIIGPDRGHQVAGRILADAPILVLEQPV